MQYPHVWELGASGAEGVKEYLTWTLNDDQRRLSAAEHMRYLRIGMHFLTVAQRFDREGNVIDKLELNFWDEDFPAEMGAGGHAHARSPHLWSFIDPRARQTVTGISLLPPDARSISGVPAEERLLTVLTKADKGDGLGTVYHPKVLGKRLTLESTATLPPGTEQEFTSLYIHEVQFEGPGTGVTVQRQGATEPDELNTFEGLTTYKGLTPDEAAQVMEHRKEIARSNEDTGQRLVASTVLVRDLDFSPDQMEQRALPVPPERYEKLGEGAIRSAERLMKTHAIL